MMIYDPTLSSPCHVYGVGVGVGVGGEKALCKHQKRGVWPAE